MNLLWSELLDVSLQEERVPPVLPSPSLLLFVSQILNLCIKFQDGQNTRLPSAHTGFFFFFLGTMSNTIWSKSNRRRRRLLLWVYLSMQHPSQTQTDPNRTVNIYKLQLHAGRANPEHHLIFYFIAEWHFSDFFFSLFTSNAINFLVS